MKKLLLLFLISFLTSFVVFAQDSDFDDDLFFEDDTIVELEPQTTLTESAANLTKGTLFEDGSIKLGGAFKTSLDILAPVFSEDEKNLKNTTLAPTLSALLSVDARPNQNLRMYTKFGFDYPFESTVTATNTMAQVKYDITDYIKVKELFTDFSIADTAFFRFGLHTVSWGTGYFFSPVSDIINTSSINPEDTSEQVNGSINLRTQVTFANTQNCLWFYVIPSTDFNNSYTTDTYIKDTALASKIDLVFGSWEFGFGGFYQYKKAPKLMATASGSLFGKVTVFAESVYQYGATSEWVASSSWEDKTNIIQATAGLSYYWKNPQITFVAQYYYDGNKKDMAHQYYTYGHNVAALISFARLFGSSDFSASILGLANFGKEELPAVFKQYVSSMGISTIYLSNATFSAMLNYSPVKAITIGIGPYITVPDWDSAPNAALKLTFTLGGGKF